MKHTALLVCLGLALGGCREERAERPAPVELSADTVGFYCQMELLDHDGPKGQIHLEGVPDPIFFSQVKDAVAYLGMPEQSHAVSAAYVQDMARAESWAEPGGWIGVEEAFYVVGSDRMGGMDAPEFVPFSDAAAARAFIARHGGSVRRFDELGGVAVSADPEASALAAGSDISARLRDLSRDDMSN